MPLWSQGPFYSNIPGYTPAEVRVAIENLDACVEYDGPFDGVLGFSQGGALAAAYIIDHQRRSKGRAPFSFAVFLSPTVVLSPDTRDCENLIRGLLESLPGSFMQSFPRVGQADLAAIPDADQRLFASYLVEAITAFAQLGGKEEADHSYLRSRDADRSTARVPRPVHPLLVKDRIGIPTVHVRGRADFPLTLRQSENLQGLCEESLARAYTHSGGHHVPTKPSEVRAVVSAIEWAVQQSQQIGAMSFFGMRPA